MDEQEQVVSENTSATPQFELNLDGKQSNTKMKKWPLIVGVAILAVLALVVALWKPVIGLFNKADEPKTIMDYEAEAFKQVQDRIINGYTSIVDPDAEGAIGTTCHIEFHIEDFALKVIEKQMPELAVLDQINDASLDAAVEHDGEMCRVNITPDHPKADLPGIELQYDPATECLFVVLAGLSEDYLKFDISELSQELDVSGDMVDTSALPAPEELEKLLSEYFDQLIELMDAGEVTEEKVSVGDVEQTCSVHTAYINAEDFVESTSKAIEAFMELCGENAQFSEQVFDMLKELESYRVEEAEELTLTWKLYIDSDDNVIGRQIVLNDEAVIDYLIVTENEDVAVSAVFGPVEFSGTGTMKDNKLSGKFILLVDDEKYLEIKPEDVYIGSCENGELSGSVSVELTDKLAEELFGSDLGLPLSFDFDFHISSDESSFDINYMDMVSLKVQLTSYVPEPIVLPEGEEINGSDPDAFYRWLGGMDIGKLTTVLEKAGLSDLLAVLFE